MEGVCNGTSECQDGADENPRMCGSTYCVCVCVFEDIGGGKVNRLQGTCPLYYESCHNRLQGTCPLYYESCHNRELPSFAFVYIVRWMIHSLYACMKLAICESTVLQFVAGHKGNSTI